MFKDAENVRRIRAASVACDPLLDEFGKALFNLLGNNSFQASCYIAIAHAAFTSDSVAPISLFLIRFRCLPQRRRNRNDSRLKVTIHSRRWLRS